MSEGTFRLTDLVKVFGPPPLHRVEPGHFVQLVSGSPKMIVVDAVGEAPDGKATVAWDAADGTHQRDEFPIVCLTAWPAADHYHH